MEQQKIKKLKEEELVKTKKAGKKDTKELTKKKTMIEMKEVCVFYSPASKKALCTKSNNTCNLFINRFGL